MELGTRHAIRNLWMLAVGLLLAIGGLIATIHQANASSFQPPPPARWMTVPCAQEDSVNCFWNAHQQGNGVGHSFYVRQFPGKTHMVCVMYASHRFARHHDYCIANNPKADACVRAAFWGDDAFHTGHAPKGYRKAVRTCADQVGGF